MRTLIKTLFISVLLLLILKTVKSQTDTASKGFLPITNDVFWDTKDEHPIYSQGGGIFRFKDPESGIEKYYWYGAQYRESALYRNDPSVTPPRDNFVSVTCYTSTDLKNWESKGDVLTRDEMDNHQHTRWAGRLGVAYIPEINKYTLFIQHNTEVLVTVADSPNGPFTWHQRINMEDMIGTSNTGDQTVFTDEDTGTSYLVYSYGKGRHKIYISEIGVKDGKVGLLDCTQVYKGAGREGNCMFKYNGKYYLFASNLYGWDSSYAYYLVADDIRGPYTPTNEMLVLRGSEADYAHVTQTGFFVKVKGSKQETVIYCGDRWANFAGNGLGYNQWCPLSFDGDTPYFNSLSAWNLNPTTGEWTVGKGNNYIKNGSFEADRRRIPSPVKPVQEQLLGWATTIVEGTKLSVSDSTSPSLNYFNTRQDRQAVIGEKSLQISDVVNFKRKIMQTVESGPYIELEDGYYTLTAKIKNSNGFPRLEMYAESDSHIVKKPISRSNETWTTIKIEKIPVRNGRVDIGFVAEGNAGAFCYVDDISLIKN
ncbi:family 43 glycosylhydrolase [Sphingobacterium sp. SGR-19]|uniref:family 43 glycosylhydrolase n=1 Tax=Sphingobacterium sp. SGR-19 TaxID=2710886 RepID=UPI0013EDCBB1|nr:family 43 glycosylhydrolase [Sphingobacterium sp. SGR-19]NGM66911.1 family 43 glycosylhydrolase [Sphingobacterium sp. SGR-19]